MPLEACTSGRHRGRGFLFDERCVPLQCGCLVQQLLDCGTFVRRCLGGDYAAFECPLDVDFDREF